MNKKANIKRKAILVFALVALLLVLHGVMTSSPAMAEHVFNDAADAVELSATTTEVSAGDAISDGLRSFWSFTGFRNCTRGNIIMILVAFVFIFLAIKYDFEPMLLIPIGVGIIIGNIPFFQDSDVDWPW